MGFEEFSVALLPFVQSPFYGGNDTESTARIVQEIRAEWPNFQNDDVEIARLYEPLPTGVFMLSSESEAGLIQLTVQLGYSRMDAVALWVRFAYCNPRSVDALFCSVVEWLMRAYCLHCRVEANLAPTREAQREISDPDALCDALLPSIEFNRLLWQSDAGTAETAVLRPGDAVARFITPQLTDQSKTLETV